VAPYVLHYSSHPPLEAITTPLPSCWHEARISFFLRRFLEHMVSQSGYHLGPQIYLYISSSTVLLSFCRPLISGHSASPPLIIQALVCLNCAYLVTPQLSNFLTNILLDIPSACEDYIPLTVPTQDKRIRMLHFLLTFPTTQRIRCFDLFLVPYGICI
jgi:hypothetical protein